MTVITLYVCDIECGLRHILVVVPHAAGFIDQSCYIVQDPHVIAAGLKGHDQHIRQHQGGTKGG